MLNTKLSNALVTVTLILASMALFVGCAGTEPALQTGVSADIPENANRLILEQEGVPPADVYVDVIHLFRLADWEVTYAEENLDTDHLTDMLNEEPLVFSAKKQVKEDLAVWITGNVETTPGGGRMIASAKYASNVVTPLGNWNDARWTSGKSKMALFEALETLRSARYDALDYEVGVMVETDEQARY